MNHICDKDVCTGCFACYNVCPVHCIDMVEDEYGFVYYDIDEDKCINCGKCIKVCPNNNELEFKAPLIAYAAWNIDSKLRESCTSGGLATTISSKIISMGGIVYGAAYMGNGKVQHIRVTKEIDLYKLKGSKYVHSYLEESFINIREDLRSNRYVVFIGTPCQIAGLKSFLSEDYPKLFLVDLVCHGVPSQKFLQDELVYISNDTDIDSISFRSNDGYLLKLYQNDNLIKEVAMADSLYYSAFMSAVSFRESCYTCKFAQPKRCSDLTIGDFWGLGKEEGCSYSDEMDKGISVALPITDKGIKLLESIKNIMFFDERTVSEAVNGNSQLMYPSIRHKKTELFRKLYLKEGLQVAARKAMSSELRIHYIKSIIKKNKYIYSGAKRIWQLLKK